MSSSEDYDSPLSSSAGSIGDQETECQTVPVLAEALLKEIGPTPRYGGFSYLADKSTVGPKMSPATNKKKKEVKVPPPTPQEAIETISQHVVLLESVMATIQHLDSEEEKQKYVVEFVEQKTEVLTGGYAELVSNEASSQTQSHVFCRAHDSSQYIGRIPENCQQNSSKSEIEAAGASYKHLLEVAKSIESTLSLVHKMAIFTYSTNAIYPLLNESLRNDAWEPWSHYIVDLVEAIRNSPPATLPKTLYRGQRSRFDDPFNVGDEMTWKGFTSLTQTEGVTEDFFGGSKERVLFKVTGVTPEIGAPIHNLSQFPYEDEVLLMPGVRFRVDAVDEQVGVGYRKFIIDVSILDPPFAAPNDITEMPLRPVISSDDCLSCKLEEILCTERPPLQGDDPQTSRQLTSILCQPKFCDAIQQSPDKWDQKMRVEGIEDRSWLYVAARNGHHTAVAYLLQQGADPTHPIGLGSTCLHAACFYGRRQCVDAIRQRSSPDHWNKLFDAKNQHELTPFDEASNYPSIIGLLYPKT